MIPRPIRRSRLVHPLLHTSVLKGAAVLRETGAPNRGTHRRTPPASDTGPLSVSPPNAYKCVGLRAPRATARACPFAVSLPTLSRALSASAWTPCYRIGFASWRSRFRRAPPAPPLSPSRSRRISTSTEPPSTIWHHRSIIARPVRALPAPPRKRAISPAIPHSSPPCPTPLTGQ